MKYILGILFIAIITNISAQTLSNDEINHERYWYLRSELRNRFVLQGEGTGRGQPFAELTMKPWSLHKTANFGDATIELGWYWTALATESSLLYMHGESTDEVYKELYDALQAFNRLDRIAELMWEGGNHKNVSAQNTPPKWNHQNKEWIMNGKNLATIESEYLSNNVNTTNLDSRWDYKNGNTGILNGFFVRSDMPAHMYKRFYNQNEAVYVNKIESSATDHSINTNTNLPNSPDTTQRATEMSKDQLASIVLGLVSIKRFVHPSATYNGQNLRQMAIDIGTRLYKMFRTQDGVLINEHNWIIHNPCNTSSPYCIRTMGATTNSFPPCDAGRCTEFSTGYGAIFDRIINDRIYQNPTLLWINYYKYHQNYVSYSTPMKYLWHNWNTLVAPFMGNPSNYSTYQTLSMDIVAALICIQFNPLPIACMSASIVFNNYYQNKLNDFGAHMGLAIAAGSNSWPNFILPSSNVNNGTPDRLYQVGQLNYDPNNPYSNVFKVYYLLNKAIFNNSTNLWKPNDIEKELNLMQCHGPEKISGALINVNYPWQTNNRWHHDISLDPDKWAGEFAGIDYMVLYNLYRILYNTHNKKSDGSQLGYYNLLDFAVNKNYPSQNGEGSHNNPKEHYVFQDLETKSKITTPAIVNSPYSDSYDINSADVTYTAGWHIKLKNGFKAQCGTKFTARINHEVCNGNTKAYPNLVKEDITNGAKRISNPITPEMANETLEYDNSIPYGIRKSNNKDIFNNSSNRTIVDKELFMLKVFPNPAKEKDLCTVEFVLNQKSNIIIELMDITNRSILTICNQKDFNKGQQGVEFSTSGISKGIYFVKMSSEVHSEIIKIIIE